MVRACSPTTATSSSIEQPLYCILYGNGNCSYLTLFKKVLNTQKICFQVQTKVPPGANRILFVKNLPYSITGDDLYDLFLRYGNIRQIRIGNGAKQKGTAYVVYEDVMNVRPCTPSSAHVSLLTPSNTHRRRLRTPLNT